MRLGDFDGLIRLLEQIKNETSNESKFTVDDFIDFVNSQPSVIEQKTAIWLPQSGKAVKPYGIAYECSSCGSYFLKSRHCPNCGARMYGIDD